ncbi:MAG TPA: ferritin-like domain-containing protein [Candidatus Eisenbacteria bacterium]|nr:ferritin-like domain-containing protein [Candidatus Eisenbacteria bacterium]
MQTDTFEKLFVEELRDMYSAEKQLVKALPKLAKAANSPELRSALEDHLDVTKEQVERLEGIFRDLGHSSSGKTCKGMAGIIEEGQNILDKDYEEEVMDAGIIAAAQKVEHYEIASYGTLRAFAETRGDRKVAEVLDEILREEKDADLTLTRIARASINTRADGGIGDTFADDEEDEEDRPRPNARHRPGDGSPRVSR